MIVTITGFSGSGNSSIAKMLAEKLRYKHYSAGDMRRKMANDREMTLAELNKLGETESWTDIEADKLIENLGKEEDNFVMDAKIGYHFIPHSFKIYLKADLLTRAKRVFQDKRKEEMFKTLEEVEEAFKKKLKSDKKRYKKYYNIETYTGKGFDFVLDTTNLSKEEICEIILDKVLEAKKTGKFK